MLVARARSSVLAGGQWRLARQSGRGDGGLATAGGGRVTRARTPSGTRPWGRRRTRHPHGAGGPVGATHADSAWWAPPSAEVDVGGAWIQPPRRPRRRANTRRAAVIAICRDCGHCLVSPAAPITTRRAVVARATPEVTPARVERGPHRRRHVAAAAHRSSSRPPARPTRRHRCRAAPPTTSASSGGSTTCGPPSTRCV
jgi:hypothetical protein